MTPTPCPFPFLLSAPFPCLLLSCFQFPIPCLFPCLLPVYFPPCLLLSVPFPPCLCPFLSQINAPCILPSLLPASCSMLPGPFPFPLLPVSCHPCLLLYVPLLAPFPPCSMFTAPCAAFSHPSSLSLSLLATGSLPISPCSLLLLPTPCPFPSLLRAHCSLHLSIRRPCHFPSGCYKLPELPPSPLLPATGSIPLPSPSPFLPAHFPPCSLFPPSCPFTSLPPCSLLPAYFPSVLPLTILYFALYSLSQLPVSYPAIIMHF